MAGGNREDSAATKRELKMKKLIIEIRAAEGGDDAKGLVLKQVKIYQKLCAKNEL